MPARVYKTDTQTFPSKNKGLEEERESFKKTAEIIADDSRVLVFQITRRDVTHNTYFPNERVLQEALDDYFRQYRKPNKRLESLCSFKYKN